MPQPKPKRACVKAVPISQNTVKSMFELGTTTRTWLDSLEDDQWTITSFDPKTRAVCIDLESIEGALLHHVSLTLPPLINKTT